MTAMVNQKMSFALSTPVYLTTASNVVVPTQKCCDTLFNVVPSNLPDGSFFLSTQDNRYLDTVFIDLKGAGSFFSVQLVPYQNIKRGWVMETTVDKKLRFHQQLDIGTVYLGLALDQRTVQGFDLTHGVFASIDLVLSS